MTKISVIVMSVLLLLGCTTQKQIIASETTQAVCEKLLAGRVAYSRNDTQYTRDGLYHYYLYMEEVCKEAGYEDGDS